MGAQSRTVLVTVQIDYPVPSTVLGLSQTSFLLQFCFCYVPKNGTENHIFVAGTEGGGKGVTREPGAARHTRRFQYVLVEYGGIRIREINMRAACAVCDVVLKS